MRAFEMKRTLLLSLLLLVLLAIAFVVWSLMTGNDHRCLLYTSPSPRDS